MTTINTETISPDIIWRLSVENYHAMIESGILTDDDPVELLEGWLVIKMAKNPPHRLVTGLIRTELEKLISGGWYVDSQEPITLANSEPEPDVMIVRGNRRDYLERHPEAKEIALVVEVADTTLPRDRNLKKRIYAAAKIPVYWLVNLIEEQIEVYTQPSNTLEQPTYQKREDYQRSQLLSVVIEGQEVGQLLVDKLLP